MKIFRFSIIIFVFCFSLFGNTMLVDRVEPRIFEEVDENDFEYIRAMENAIIDLCFDSGIMVFNVQSYETSMENDSSVTLGLAEQKGAAYLLRIQSFSEEKKMIFQFYSVRNQDMLLSGEWNMDSWSHSEDQTLPEFYYQAGQSTMNQLIPLFR